MITSREWGAKLDGSPIAPWAVEELLEHEGNDRRDGPHHKVDRSGIRDLHLGFDRAAEGDRRKPSQYLPFSAQRERILGIREDDRVYQGFSVAFDMSFEEIWISYLARATLG